MEKITLRLKEPVTVPLEAEVISPDTFQGKTRAEIEGLPVYCGNEEGRLGDFFAVQGAGGREMVLEGDLSRVKQIGAGMTQGRISIYGDAGMHLGATMRGGEIIVHGNASDWVGAEMAGGMICIQGNAGHGLGGAYRGSVWGMNRGLIMVGGDAGNEVGNAMRRGVIVVQGNTGDFTGAFMIAGTIIALGRLGDRAGAGMKRGTIVAFHRLQLLPTFRYDCTYKPTFLRLLLIGLRARGVDIGDAYLEGQYLRYSGDLTTLGKGEILIWEGA